MAKIAELNEAGWQEWVASQPPCVQELCKRLPPDRLYRMKSTGQRVTILSYGEDDRLRVNITGRYNAIMFDRQVFGIDADDLEECDLPGPDEALGTVLTDDGDVKAYIDAARPAILAQRRS